jgi:hypothetical protein
MPRKPLPPDPPAVVLRPPVELMQPRPVRELPAEDGMPGGTVYEVKLDGFRVAVFRTGAGVELWSRRGRSLTDRLPEVLPALEAALDGGTVLDGEVCAVVNGRLEFTGLLRSPAHRAVGSGFHPFLGRRYQPGVSVVGDTNRFGVDAANVHREASGPPQDRAGHTLG